MDLLRIARGRLAAFGDELTRLHESDFPYQASKEAIEVLQKQTSDRLSSLQLLDDKSDLSVVSNACSETLDFLHSYQPLAGMILRSTNARNAFELYGPLFKMVRLSLGSTARLIISSEWEYSPLVYLEPNYLHSFVLLGLPASESSNSLLLPLAGHEIGHSVWRHLKLHQEIQSEFEDRIIQSIPNHWTEFKTLVPGALSAELRTNIPAREQWKKSFSWGMRQLEEIFCDAYGIRTFGASFLHAFAYLIAPGTAGRSQYYPALSSRVEYHDRAAKQYGVDVPPYYLDLFRQSSARRDLPNILTRISDEAVSTMVDWAIDRADKVASECNILLPTRAEIAQVYSDLSKLVPASNSASLAAVLNGAWDSVFDKSLWTSLPKIDENDRGRVLNELVLKSVEVLEIESRLRESDAKS